jgi:hypothetical protein
MKILRTEIEINASPEKIWHILADLGKYPEWNPFIHHALGTAEAGGKVDIKIKSGSKELALHCSVLKAEPNRELRWSYHVGLPFLFRGEHSFIIESVGDNRVHFIDQEVFNGFFVPSQAKDIDTNSKQGFEAMDKALKTRAESSK